MTLHTVLAAVLVAGSSMIALAAASEDTCPILSDSKRAQLAQYVERKYKLPPSVRLS